MRRRHGFTLLELMVYLALLGVLTAAATPLLVASAADRRLGESLADDALALRRAADALERDLRCGRALWIGVEQARLHDDDGEVRWDLDRGVLRRRGPAGESEVLRRVAGFEIARDGACVRYAMTLEPRTVGATRRAHVAGAVAPRVTGEEVR